jgi:hypothetical protein
MVALETFRELALALPGVTEELHFGRMSFAVGKKRFTSFDPRKGELAIKLPLTDPVRLDGAASGVLVPAPGKYGAEGWTMVDLERIGKTEFVKLLEIAHAGVVAGRKK